VVEFVDEYLEKHAEEKSKRLNIINHLSREFLNGLTTISKNARSTFTGERMKQFLQENFKVNVKFMNARELYNQAKKTGMCLKLLQEWICTIMIYLECTREQKKKTWRMTMLNWRRVPR
jgi:hypothetical protein